MSGTRLQVTVKTEEEVPGFLDAVSDYFWENHWFYELTYKVDPSVTEYAVIVNDEEVSRTVAARVRTDLKSLYESFQEVREVA